MKTRRMTIKGNVKWKRMPAVISTSRAAELFKVSDSTIWNWIYRGLLEARKNGKEWLIDKSYLKRTFWEKPQKNTFTPYEELKGGGGCVGAPQEEQPEKAEDPNVEDDPHGAIIGVREDHVPKTDKGTVIGKGRWLILDSRTEALGVQEAIGRALDAAVSEERETQEEYDKAKALLDELQARLDECVKTTRNYRALYDRISFVARKHSDEEGE